MSPRVSNPLHAMNTRQVPPSATLGIDLASQPARTAACRIDWGSGCGVARLLSEQKLTDQALLGLMRDVSVTKIAIDAPFGWPTEFVRAVTDWHDDLTWPLAPDPGSAQEQLVLRATDRDVWHGAGSSEAGMSEDMTGGPARVVAR